MRKPNLNNEQFNSWDVNLKVWSCFRFADELLSFADVQTFANVIFVIMKQNHWKVFIFSSKMLH